uniref:nucleoside-diphosphate kinase n=1 Tax=Megaselia scalaris TaxID=36166 RepID=T1GAJ5_MEGSC
MAINTLCVYFGANSNNCQPIRAFIMVITGGVQRGLVGKIIESCEQKGFKLIAMKFMWAEKESLEKHYVCSTLLPRAR